MTGRDFIACAERWANSTIEADLRGAVSRAYYGAFHESRSLLRENGIQLPKTEQVHVKIAYCLQDCGAAVAETAGQQLEFLRTQRKTADYDLQDARFRDTGRVRAEVDRALRIVAGLEQCRSIDDFSSKVRAQARLLGLSVGDQTGPG